MPWSTSTKSQSFQILLLLPLPSSLPELECLQHCQLPLQKRVLVPAAPLSLCTCRHLFEPSLQSLPLPRDC